MNGEADWRLMLLALMLLVAVLAIWWVDDRKLAGILACLSDE